ncbi:MAG: hypothetical protein KJZ72_04595 [Anaerolineales bacterium]|nr:hypothetical protein [Anaerolineales bacterium]
MNIQSFYEYVILRDILAFMLPGGISLAGIYMVIHALDLHRWQKNMPFLSEMNPIFSSFLLTLIAFLIGHVWDMVYRLVFQKRPWYQRKDTVRRILIGDSVNAHSTIGNHIPSEIREATGEFLRIDWAKTPIDQWVESGKAYEASVLLSYWIEEEDPKLFGTEIARPIVQSHLLHVCGMAFLTIGGFFTPLVAIIYESGINISQEYDPLTLWILAITTLVFGMLLISQGRHKREIILEHVFRVFYVIWRKRSLESKLGTMKEPSNKRTGKGRK